MRLRVIAGTLLGLTSPVRTFSSLGYGALELARGARCVLPAEHEERAVYLVDGDLTLDGEAVPAGACATLLPGRAVELRAASACRCMVLGAGRPPARSGPKSAGKARFSRLRPRGARARIAP